MISEKIVAMIIILVVIVGFIGWVKDIIKFIHTDFHAPYKAEIIYGVGISTGAGAIIGWFNIED